jgi:hypothetical protein
MRTLLIAAAALLLAACTHTHTHSSPDRATVMESASGASTMRTGGGIDARFAPRRLRAGLCELGSCQIRVDVANDGGTCTPRLDDLVKVTRRGVTVTWVITSGNWIWAARDGIAFKHGGPFAPGVRVSDTDWSVKNNGPARGYFDYGINLVDHNGRTCSFDPGLITDWSSEPPIP